jgi:hypothetical protein
MFTIYFIRKLGDAPIEQRQSDAKDVMDAVREAEQVIDNAVETGLLRDPELGCRATIRVRTVSHPDCRAIVVLYNSRCERSPCRHVVPRQTRRPPEAVGGRRRIDYGCMCPLRPLPLPSNCL